MKLIAQDEGWVAVFKPEGFHVHPPENNQYPPPRDHVMLYLVRDLVGSHVFPVHRLDVATSGVLLMATSADSASKLAQQFQNRCVKKEYLAVVRGWPAESGEINRPLSVAASGEPIEALTRYWRLAKIELPEAVGPKFKTARYSYLKIEPETGRYHQIRRHFNRISNPLIGDVAHGDHYHNEFFREKLKISGLCLKAQRLEFLGLSGQRQCLEAPMDPKWEKLAELFKDGS